MTDADILKTLMDLTGCGNQSEVGDILGLTQASISGVLTGKKHLGGPSRKFAEHLIADAESQIQRDAEKLRRIAAILSEE